MNANSVCPLDCPDSCSLTVTVEEGRATAIDGSATNPYTDGYICAKVRKLPQHVHGEGRLLHPMVRRGPKGEGAFERVSWDEALALVARKLEETRDEHGGEAILPLCYGGSNGALTHGTLDERLWRRLGSSELLPTVCAAPSGAAAQGLYGKMPGVALPDYVHARLIVLWGVNPNARAMKSPIRVILVPVSKRTKLGTGFAASMVEIAAPACLNSMLSTPYRTAGAPILVSVNSRGRAGMDASPGLYSMMSGPATKSIGENPGTPVPAGVRSIKPG